MTSRATAGLQPSVAEATLESGLPPGRPTLTWRQRIHDTVELLNQMADDLSALQMHPCSDALTCWRRQQILSDALLQLCRRLEDGFRQALISGIKSGHLGPTDVARLAGQRARMLTWCRRAVMDVLLSKAGQRPVAMAEQHAATHPPAVTRSTEPNPPAMR